MGKRRVVIEYQSMTPGLLALDWGTSSLRAYLLGVGSGGELQTLDARHAPWGIMNLFGNSYPTTLAKLCGDWLASYPDLPLLAAGMVGSAQGWVEAPYAPCPAGATQLAAQLASVPLSELPPGAERSLLIVPGVLQLGALPNVMRGEETQIVGALALGDTGDGGLFVLPGTHSKWAAVRAGLIERFSTFMTGELFATLRKHTILGKLMSAEAENSLDEAAFKRGLDVALQTGTGGLPATLFTVRTLGLTKALGPGQLPDYLSGLLIGCELAGALDTFGKTARAQTLTLIGDAELCARYAAALSHTGFAPARTIARATEAGLWQIANSAGLLGPGKAA